MTLESVPPPSSGNDWLRAANTATSFTSATLLVGITGAIITQGHDGLAFTLGIAGAVFLLATVLAPLLAATPVLTSPDRSLPALLARRYVSPAAGHMASAVLVLALTGLLTAEITVLSTAASSVIVWWLSTRVVAVALAAAVIAALAVKTKSPTGIWIAAGSILAVLAALAVLSGHDGFGALISLPTIPDISALEQGLITKHLADPATYKPYASAFLRTDRLNTLALITGLSIGMATLACARTIGLNSPPQSARSRSRGALLLMGVIIFIPALAACARRTLLALFADGLKADGLPYWLNALQTSGAIQICGTTSGDHAALVKACGKSVGPLGLMRWHDVTFAPDGALFSALAATPSGTIAAVLLVIAGGLAALWTARQIVTTIADLVSPSGAATSTGAQIVIVAAVFAAAGLFGATHPAPSATLLAWSASFAAAGLAPALLAAFVRRPSRIAALIAIPFGAITALTLILSARYVPLDAFAFSSAVGGAPPVVIRKMGALLQTMVALPEGPDREAIATQIESLARDNVSWFGLKPLASGVIGLALGALVIIAGSAAAVFIKAGGVTPKPPPKP